MELSISLGLDEKVTMQKGSSLYDGTEDMFLYFLGFLMWVIALFR